SQHDGELAAVDRDVGIVQSGGRAGTAIGVTAVGIGHAHTLQPERGRGGGIAGTGGGCSGGCGHGYQFPPRASSGSTRVTRRVAMTEPIRPITTTPATGTSTVKAEASNGATVDSAAPPRPP